MKMKTIPKISEYREKLLETLLDGYSTGARDMGKIRNKWKELFPEYAETVWPKELTKDVLSLEVQSHLVYAEIVFSKHRISQILGSLIQKPTLTVRFYLVTN